jgi:lipopolysaccharide biosynthesis regulator YciM
VSVSETVMNEWETKSEQYQISEDKLGDTLLFVNTSNHSRWKAKRVSLTEGVFEILRYKLYQVYLHEQPLEQLDLITYQDTHYILTLINEDLQPLTQFPSKYIKQAKQGNGHYQCLHSESNKKMVLIGLGRLLAIGVFIQDSEALCLNLSWKISENASQAHLVRTLPDSFYLQTIESSQGSGLGLLFLDLMDQDKKEFLDSVQEIFASSLDQVYALLRVACKHDKTLENRLVSDFQERHKILGALLSKTAASSSPIQNGPNLQIRYQVPPADKEFIGRAQELQQLQDSLNQAHRSVRCLTGASGLGKSHLALSYAHNSTELYQSIIWIQADLAIEPQIRALAQTINPSLSKAPLDDMVQELYKILVKRGATLIIWDNGLVESLTQNYFPSPKLSQGTIHTIITSQNSDWKSISCINLEISPFSQDDARAYLRSQFPELTKESFSSFSDSFLEMLQFHPLGIKIASKYILQGYANLESFAQQYHFYQLCQRSSLEVSKNEAAVRTCAGLSFIALERDYLEAWKLLQMTRGLAPYHIPWQILENLFENLQITKELAHLESFALIKWNPQNKTFSSHEFIFSLLEERELAESNEKYLQSLLSGLIQQFQTGSKELSRLVASHAHKLLRNTKPSPTRANLALKLGEHYLAIGDAISSIEPLEIALCDTPQQSSVEILKHLANAHGIIHKYDFQVSFLERALSIQESHSGDTLEERSEILLLIAQTHKQMGDYPLQQQFAERQLKLLTSSQESTTKNNIAQISLGMRSLSSAYQAQENFQAAITTLKELLSQQESILGENHLDLVHTLKDLANVLILSNQETQAIPLLERSLNIQQRLSNSPEQIQEIASSLFLLGKTFGTIGNFEEELSYFQRALQQFERFFGANHKNLTQVLSWLGSSLAKHRNQQEGLDYLQRAVEIHQSTPDRSDSDFAECLGIFGETLNQLAQYQSAKNYLQQALEILKKSSEIQTNDHNSRLALILMHLADSETQLNEFKQAKSHFEQAIEILKTNKRNSHSDTGKILLLQAALFGQMRDYSNQISSSNQALEIFENTLGKNHWWSVGCLVERAKGFSSSNRIDEAISLLEQGIQILENSYGKDHYHSARVLELLADLYSTKLTSDSQPVPEQRVIDRTKPKQLLKQTLRIQEKSLPPDHPNIARNLSKLAEAYGAIADLTGELKHFRKELSLARKSLEILQKIPNSNWNSNRLDLNNSAIHLGLALFRLGEKMGDWSLFKEAKPLLEQGVKFKEAFYTGTHNAQLAHTRVILAQVNFNLGFYLEAKLQLERAIYVFEQLAKIDQGKLGCALLVLGKVLDHLGNYQVALSTLEQSASIFSNLTGSEGQLGVAMTHSGNVLISMGNYQQAKQTLENARSMVATHFGDDSIAYAFVLTCLAKVNLALNDVHEAKSQLELARMSYEQHFGADYPEAVPCLVTLAKVFRTLADYNEANSLLMRALTIQQRFLKADHPDLVETFVQVAITRSAMGAHNDAKKFFEKILQSQVKLLGATHQNLVDLHEHLGRCCLKLGQYREALPQFSQALAIVSAHNISSRIPPILKFLVVIYDRLGMQDELSSTLAQLTQLAESKKELGNQSIK